MKARTQVDIRGRLPLGALGPNGGAVYVEFLLAFIPLFFLFLGMTQIALVYAAGLVVQHAGVTATRAAAVVLDDDPRQYGNEPRLTINGSAAGGESEDSSALGELFGGGDSGSTSVPDMGGRRFRAIRSAASIPLLALAPSPEAIAVTEPGENVRDTLGRWPVEARAGFGLMYNRMAMSVTFPTAPGQRSYRDTWEPPDENGDAGEVTVRVTYLYHCGIPLANRLMCDDLFALQYGADWAAARDLVQRGMDGSVTLDDIAVTLRNRDWRRTDDRFEDRMEELSGAGGAAVDVLAIAAGISGVLGGPNPRFIPLEYEGTMPLMAANYCYEGQSGGDCWEQD